MSEPAPEPGHWHAWHDDSWPQANPIAEDLDEQAPVDFDGAYDWPDWYH